MSTFRDRIAHARRSKIVRAYGPVMIGGVSLLVIRHYVVVGSMKETTLTADNKTVIITGPTTGIGEKVALKFVKKGARVILACQNEERCKAVRRDMIYRSGNKEVSVRKLDLSSLESINNFATIINKSEEKLDILINNAAVMVNTHSEDKEVTKEGFEMQMGSNYLGHFILTNLLLDKLKANTDGSHIINVTCSAMKKGNINFDDFNYDAENSFKPRQAYRDSKLALWLFTKELSQKLESSNTRVNAVNPGGTASKLDRNMTYHSSWISSFFLSPIRKLILKNTDQAAVPIINLALHSDYKHEHGSFINPHGKREVKDLGDEQTRKKLWLLSEKWTRLR